MTHKGIETLIMLGVAPLFTYLVFAFICWDWSPADWSSGARFFAVIIWFLFAGIMLSDEKAAAK